LEVEIDENNEEQAVEKNSRKRKAYTIGFKLDAVKFAKQSSINVSQIRIWPKNIWPKNILGYNV
jgi:hypothetical protein